MSAVKCGLGWKGPLKVIYAEVECRVVQDKGIAALTRQLVTKEILEWFGLEGPQRWSQSPARSRDTFS